MAFVRGEDLESREEEEEEKWRRKRGTADGPGAQELPSAPHLMQLPPLPASHPSSSSYRSSSSSRTQPPPSQTYHSLDSGLVHLQLQILFLCIFLLDYSTNSRNSILIIITALTRAAGITPAPSTAAPTATVAPVAGYLPIVEAPLLS